MAFDDIWRFFFLEKSTEKISFVSHFLPLFMGNFYLMAMSSENLKDTQRVPENKFWHLPNEIRASRLNAKAPCPWIVLHFPWFFCNSDIFDCPIALWMLWKGGKRLLLLWKMPGNSLRFLVLWLLLWCCHLRNKARRLLYELAKGLILVEIWQ